MLSISHHTNHLLWRAGFGPTPDMLSQPTPFNAHTYFEALVIASQKTKLQPLEVSKNLVDGLANGIGQLGRLQQLSRNEQLTQRQQMARQSRQELRSLNLLWLEEMVQSTAQLREKMALFWHGHFACRNLNSYFQQHLLQQIRENALGNFGALLHAVSKSPAMLAFLNNQQNRKQSPNENFAREVMELFTLGRGNYTELDIKEAARAFTGWGFDASGQFVFRRLVHDAGTKTVLGTTGNLTGDEVLDLLLAKKQTALFITQKLYRFLVNETAPPERIAWLAERFYQSGYEILPLLKDIFTAKWFYNQENIGNRIKGPIEWWVGLRRMLPMQIANPEIQLLLQRSLGQVLFYPPNVAGWPGGTNWIDGNSLLLRMRIPMLLPSTDALEIPVKTDDDVEMGRMERTTTAKLASRFKLNADINWNLLSVCFEQLKGPSLQEQIAQALIMTPVKPPVHWFGSPGNIEYNPNAIASLAIQYMSTPEYQLC